MFGAVARLKRGPSLFRGSGGVPDLRRSSARIGSVCRFFATGKGRSLYTRSWRAAFDARRGRGREPPETQAALPHAHAHGGDGLRTGADDGADPRGIGGAGHLGRAQIRLPRHRGAARVRRGRARLSARAGGVRRGGARLRLPRACAARGCGAKLAFPHAAQKRRARRGGEAPRVSAPARAARQARARGGPHQNAERVGVLQRRPHPGGACEAAQGVISLFQIRRGEGEGRAAWRGPLRRDARAACVRRRVLLSGGVQREARRVRHVPRRPHGPHPRARRAGGAQRAHRHVRRAKAREPCVRHVQREPGRGDAFGERRGDGRGHRSVRARGEVVFGGRGQGARACDRYEEPRVLRLARAVRRPRARGEAAGVRVEKPTWLAHEYRDYLAAIAASYDE